MARSDVALLLGAAASRGHESLQQQHQYAKHLSDGAALAYAMREPSSRRRTRKFYDEDSDTAEDSVVLSALRRDQPLRKRARAESWAAKHGWIGEYCPDERAELIERFLAKRQRRIWSKKVRYDCRKDLAVGACAVRGGAR